MDKSLLIFGEVLIDKFDTGIERRGGAPFNVAWHLNGFKENPLFISRVGKDAPGQKLISDMESWNMPLTGIQKDIKRPTGYVSVKNRATNPEFEIHNNVAYDFIDPNEIDSSILNKHFDLIYHGSLALRNPLSRSAFEVILTQSKNVPVFFDVNLRPPWWDLKTIQNYMSRTNYLKCNETELKQLIPDVEDSVEAAKILLKEFNLDVVIVTLGEKGAFICNSKDECFHAASEINEKIINSVGAGDGFSAVMILGIIHNWPAELALKRANQFASTICTIDGAVPDSKEFYRSFSKQWK
jgi:fructokinase